MPAAIARRARAVLRSLALALVLASPLWFGVAAGFAFEAAARGTAGAAAQDPGAAAAEPGAHASPRAALEGFARDAAEWRATRAEAALERAARALDLSGYPSADRAYLRSKLTQDLGGLLEQLGPLDASSLPDAASVGGATRVARTFARADRPELALEIELVRVADGDWRIARSTLDRVAAWTERFRASAPVAGDAPRDGLRAALPEGLRRRVAFLEAWQWLGFAVLVLVGILAQRIVSYFFARFVAHVSKSERMAVDSKHLTRVARPLALLATSLAFFAGVPLLDLEPRAYHVVNLLANVGLTFAVVWAAYRLVDVLSWVMSQRASATETKFDDMLVPLLRRTLKFVVVILGVVLIVTRLDRDLWGLVAGLSIGSLAVGFAAKDSIENLFGTFTVLTDKPFQLGDVVVVNGIEGSVEDVGFRSTRLRTGEDSLITVPNSTFIAAHVENRGLRRRLRVRATLGIEYDTPPEKIEGFCEGIRELIRRHPYTRKSDYNIWMTGFGPSSLDLQLTFFFEVPDPVTEARERHRLFLDVLRLAERSGVGFAFPTQTVRLERVQSRAGQDGADATSQPETATALGEGRKLAGEIADASLRRYSGRRPPPIRFDTQDADDAGHGRIG